MTPTPDSPEGLTVEELARLKSMDSAATPGPWAVHCDWPENIVIPEQARRPLGGSVDEERDRDTYAHPLVEIPIDTYSGWPHRRADKAKAYADAAFIVAARNAFPVLITQVELLTAERDEAREARRREHVLHVENVGSLQARADTLAAENERLKAALTTAIVANNRVLPSRDEPAWVADARAALAAGEPAR